MDVLGQDADGLTVRLDRDEIRLVNNSLSEVCHGIHIPEHEYDDRLGRSRWETEEVLEAIHRQYQDWYLSPWLPQPGPVDARGVKVELSWRDLKLIRDALALVTDGDQFWDDEFATRLGVKIEEGRRFLAEAEVALARRARP